MTMTDIFSNRLIVLGAEIKADHEVIKGNFKDTTQRSMAMGDKLLEAKDLLKHGQWLPWLRDHCTISERTAQLYMRMAKNREAVEAKSATVADLTLNEAVAMLALSSDMKKLLEFAKEASKLTDPDEFVQFCAANDVACLQGNIFGAPEPTPQEIVEWALFQLFLVQQCAYTPESASHHAGWVQSRGTLLKDWMGPVGVSFREHCGSGPTQGAVDAWQPFLAANQHRTLDDVKAEFKRAALARVEMLKEVLSAGKYNGRKLSKKNRGLILEELDRFDSAC